jgi:hypothetical protein
MFGLSYREHDVDGRPFIFPTTTPTQFEPEAMHASIDRLLAFAPEVIYLTHYSRVETIAQLGADLHRRLDAMVALAEAAPGNGEERHRSLKAFLTGYLIGELRGHGCSLPVATALGIWDTDLELNAQGLEAWLDARQTSAPAG